MCKGHGGLVSVRADETGPRRSYHLEFVKLSTSPATPKMDASSVKADTGKPASNGSANILAMGGSAASAGFHELAKAYQDMAGQECQPPHGIHPHGIHADSGDNKDASPVLLSAAQADDRGR